MLEDSAEYKFENLRLTDPVISSIISDLRKKSSLPDLRAVYVYTVVPGVAAPAKADEVRAFWIRYFEAARARLRYGTLSDYPPQTK